MTLYFDADEQQIIENHPHYVEFDDDGHLVINFDEIERADKKRMWVKVTQNALDDSDEYSLDSEAEMSFVPRDDRQ